MKIRTDQPLIQDRAVITEKIKSFWNKTSEGWRTVWGQHIHHGYYENNEESPQAAQEKLIEKLVLLLEIKPQDKLLDVGSGLGGSSIYLAKKCGACVTGITISNKQIALAKEAAQKAHVDNITFQIQDALALGKLGKEAFDIIWSLESCEQFHDKALFLQQSYYALKQHGQLMLATWCSDREEYADELAHKYRKLCLAFDLPYMPTIAHYRELLAKQGFVIKKVLDWTPLVKKSWDVGISLVNAYNFLQVLKSGGWRGFRFTRQIKLMQEAFHQDRVRYGVFIAVKP